jgi:NADPH-dependent 2,4-dienoyl-CoA reductase/sulfur reductase-like enzyme
MKIVIVGAVAGGTSAAAQARRNNSTAQIRIYEKGSDISYSACGLPYHIGGLTGIDELVPRDAQYFAQKYNAEVRTRHEVLKIDKGNKEITVKNLADGSVFNDSYDILVIATGASAVIPPIPGTDGSHVFTLRNTDDARAIKKYLETRRAQTAAVVGSGFIGLEMADNLQRHGLGITLIEMLPSICPALDPDMAHPVQDHLQMKNVEVLTSQSVLSISERGLMLAGGKEVRADMVLLAAGTRPNVALAAKAGVEIGTTGAISVNRKMQTNIPGIYACGDCAESFSVIDGKPLYRPLGSTANKMGRITGDAITGGSLQHRGEAGTWIFKVFDMTVASTGYTEREARSQGFEPICAHTTRPDKPGYFGGQNMTIKTIADARTERLIGAQIIGIGGVDTRIDVLATAITHAAKASDIFHLDLAYAPPYATANDPVHYAGLELDLALRKSKRN